MAPTGQRLSCVLNAAKMGAENSNSTVIPLGTEMLQAGRRRPQVRKTRLAQKSYCRYIYTNNSLMLFCHLPEPYSFYLPEPYFLYCLSPRPPESHSHCCIHCIQRRLQPADVNHHPEWLEVGGWKGIQVIRDLDSRKVQNAALLISAAMST